MIEINDKKYYSIREVGEILDMEESCVRNLIRLGRLKCFRPSIRKAYIEASNIQKYIEG